jgi:hypothetical protein
MNGGCCLLALIALPFMILGNLLKRGGYKN